MPGNTVEMLADWLGAGLDPERSTLFIQSLVPEHAELHLLFSMTTPVTWLERVPTYRERIEQQHLESPSYGLLGYPLLQSADILMYKPRWVPVGIDQAPHVELTREVARRFNHSFARGVPRARGQADRDSEGAGHRRAEDVEVVRQHDRSRRRRADDHTQGPADGDRPGAQATDRPGQSGHLPRVRSAQDLHAARRIASACASGCRTAGIGCLDCKDVLLKHMLPPLAAIRERRQVFAEKPDRIVEILHEGSRRARKVAQATMDEVRAAVHLTP